jgi:hypothetical protein
MINITYADGGHTLVATKVTGDENVPRGEVTFTVDLAPPRAPTSYSGNDAAAGGPSAAPASRGGLDPIELDADARRRWGRRYLPRHPGRGRVASADFADPKWMEGQMILVGEFFSFAWVPIGRQIFFGRPSAELTIRMMREAEEGKRGGRGNNGRDDAEGGDDVGAMREVAMSMLEETYWVEKESNDDSVGGDSFGGEGCFE